LNVCGNFIELLRHLKNPLLKLQTAGKGFSAMISFAREKTFMGSSRAALRTGQGTNERFCPNPIMIEASTRRYFRHGEIVFTSVTGPSSRVPDACVKTRRLHLLD
jgi:hypothetical protein